MGNNALRSALYSRSRLVPKSLRTALQMWPILVGGSANLPELYITLWDIHLSQERKSFSLKDISFDRAVKMGAVSWQLAGRIPKFGASAFSVLQNSAVFIRIFGASLKQGNTCRIIYSRGWKVFLWVQPQLRFHRSFDECLA